MKTIDKIITKVNGRYGAPMGRFDVGSYPVTVTKGRNGKIFKKYQTKVFDSAVPMLSGGYDKGGAYWGYGTQLRVSYTKDLSYIHFYRIDKILK